MLHLQGDALAVDVAELGAELQSLRATGPDGAERELLWQGGPPWPRRSPVLFPVVGRLAGDVLRTRAGAQRAMAQHGFARDRSFAVVHRTGSTAELVLADDAETRARFPYAFRLALRYEVTDALRVTYVVGNPGPEVLPCSVGAHPAFAWPLVPGVAREAHALEFDEPEPEPVRRLQDSLLHPEPRPTPVEGRRLALHDGLFAEDALVWDAVRSRGLVYSAPGAPRLRLTWDGFPQLGVWSRAGGGFVCLEPWHGHADPVGFDGAFEDKPGLLHVPPGEERVLSWELSVSP